MGINDPLPGHQDVCSSHGSFDSFCYSGSSHGKGAAKIRRLGVEADMKRGDVTDSDPDGFKLLPYSNI
ncbi:MAG: hypothetical protein UBAL2_85240076 [Leptospirillum rubarum]|jgi:hypothetical protein|uniref:Uncharacterized protein n=1 Tax=Leptospirillum sp. Group II '5-way CG' TaxID=419541 RepID=B6ANJ5_9BACT|nr:MAG: hypothetical protein UBAL2_85240076 [Leptospirillum rubarum]EDZ38831.1 MAG: Hypothetical protein CGL2_10580003 [Leptospirillum sp. Group II '5-way CG']